LVQLAVPDFDAFTPRFGHANRTIMEMMHPIGLCGKQMPDRIDENDTTTEPAAVRPSATD
jgi:hypothetical protein